MQKKEGKSNANVVPRSPTAWEEGKEESLITTTVVTEGLIKGLLAMSMSLRFSEEGGGNTTFMTF